jgi:hypothetical protein
MGIDVCGPQWARQFQIFLPAAELIRQRAKEQDVQTHVSIVSGFGPGNGIHPGCGGNEAGTIGGSFAGRIPSDEFLKI